MASSGMLRRVALVRTDVSEGHSATIIRVTTVGEIGTTSTVTSNRLLVTGNFVPVSLLLVSLMMEAIHSSETRFLQDQHGVTSQNTTFS
jgi:hypothetical protein